MKVVLVIALAISLQGCDAFSTRTPETPDVNSRVFEPATTPEVLIDNFKHSVEWQQTNGFSQCFTEENEAYLFVAATDATSVFGALFDTWTVENELSWFDRWINDSPVGFAPLLKFENDLLTIGGPQSAVLETNYIFVTGTESSTDIDTVAGSMFLTISTGSDGLWYISEWRDDVTSSTRATWSMLKGQLVN